MLTNQTITLPRVGYLTGHRVGSLKAISENSELYENQPTRLSKVANNICLHSCPYPLVSCKKDCDLIKALYKDFKDNQVHCGKQQVMQNQYIIKYKSTARTLETSEYRVCNLSDFTQMTNYISTKVELGAQILSIETK